MTEVAALLSNLTFGPNAQGPFVGKQLLDIMQCVAYVSGKALPGNGAPRCSCPVVAVMATYVNDCTPQNGGNGLALRLLRLAGSNRGRSITKDRAAYLADFAFKTVTPNILRAETDFSPAPERDAMATLFEALPTLGVRTNHLRAFRLADALRQPALIAGSAGLANNLQRISQRFMSRDVVAMTRSVTELFSMFDTDVDLLTLLDHLLDIGASAELPLTPKVVERLQALASVQTQELASAVVTQSTVVST